MVDRQIQKVQEPSFGRPGWNHEQKLQVGPVQLSQNLGEKLMRKEGAGPQILPWKPERVHCHTGAGDRKVRSVVFHLVMNKPMRGDPITRTCVP